MKTLKTRTSIIILMVIFALLSSCATNKNGVKYENGYFIVTLHEKFEDVYSATLKAIKTGQTYDADNTTYDLRVNEKTKDKAVIAAISQTEPSDFVEVIMAKTSADATRITIKYGRQGDTIRSSALIDIIKSNIRESK